MGRLVYEKDTSSKALLKVTAEKRRKGYVAERGKGLRPKPPAKAAVTVPPTWRAAMVALARKLGGASLVTEVELAADDQLAYLKKFRKRMEDISVEEPRRNLPWLALVEGLAARKKAVELDWKHESDDALVWVQRLAGAAGKKALAPIAKDPQLAERRTDEALEQFGGALAAAKLALIVLDKDSDSYVVMVVPTRDVAALQKLAKQCVERIEHLSGKRFKELEKERTRAQKHEKARETSKNRWTQMAERNWPKSTDGVLWQLRHHPYPVEEIRAAAEDAPARDQPLIAMTLAIHDQPATKVARTTKDPALCLRALRYLGTERFHPEERLGATAIVVDRLRIEPGTGPVQKQVMYALNLFSEPEKADRAVTRLPAAMRQRLARLADAYLKGAKHQSERWNDAYHALRNVADETSIAAIEASRSKIWADFAGEDIKEIDEALARIRARAGKRAG